MPRTFRPSKSPTRTRDSMENVERPLAPAEAPPSRGAAAVGPTAPRVALESPEEKALASRRHQEVMARSKSPPRQLRPQAMPKIAAPVSCAEAGYHSRPNRTHSAEGSCLSAGHHPRLWAARHALEASAHRHAPAAQAPSNRSSLPTLLSTSRCRRQLARACRAAAARRRRAAAAAAPARARRCAAFAPHVPRRVPPRVRPPRHSTRAFARGWHSARARAGAHAATDPRKLDGFTRGQRRMESTPKVNHASRSTV